MDRILYSKDNIEVRQGGGIRSLWLNGACMGRAEATRPNIAVSQYMKEIIAIVYHIKPYRTLVIGGGACLIPSAFPTANICVVEPNLNIMKIARQFFRSPDFCWHPDVEDVHADEFQCVILDAYNDNTPVPELYNEEFYNRFKTSHLIVNEVKNGCNHIWQRAPIYEKL